MKSLVRVWISLASLVAMTTWIGPVKAQGVPDTQAHRAGPSGHPDWMAESNAVYGELGWGLGTAGDVNGDGYDDVIAGAYLYSDGEPQEGAAFLYPGSKDGLARTPAWRAE